jgi:hypothetical protein
MQDMEPRISATECEHTKERRAASKGLKQFDWGAVPYLPVTPRMDSPGCPTESRPIPIPVTSAIALMSSRSSDPSLVADLLVSL